MSSKLSYIHTPAQEPLDPRIIPQLFDDQASAFPAREAIVFYDENGQRHCYTYSQLRQKSLALAASFLRLGWKPHDRVMVLAHNGLEFLTCFLAITRIAVNPLLVPLGTRPEQVLAMLTRLKCRAFVGHPSGQPETDAKFVEKILQAMADTPAEEKRNVIFIGDNTSAVPGACYLSDVLKSGEGLDVGEVLKVQESIQFDDHAVVVFTSGSTGDPKAVQHTHHSLVNAGLVSARRGYMIGRDENYGVTPQNDIRVFNDRPFYWAACLGWGIMLSITTASTLVCLPTKKTVREGDARFVLKILQDEKATHALLMPYLVRDILAMGTANFDLSSLRFGILTGQPIFQTLVDDLINVLPWCLIATGYGMTEKFPNGFLHLSKDGTRSVLDGMVLPDNDEVKIVDDNNKVVPIGTPGEICLRGPSKFAGFLEDPEETSKAISSTGWFHTGDIGVVNEKGRFRICGRKTDMIKRATSKLYPAEVEKVLCQHPKIKAVVVVGVPDQRFFEELCACVIPKEVNGRTLKELELEEWETSQWEGEQHIDEQGLTLKPRYNIFLESFPLLETGKTDRRALRRVAMEKLGIEDY